MKISRAAAAMLMVSFSSPLFAGAEQSMGTLTSATDGVFVAHDGKLVPAVSGQALFAGDRVVTRGKASAKVSLSGCSYNMAPTSMLSVSSTACSGAPASFAPDDATGTAGAGATSGGISGTTIIVGVLAAAAVGGGVYAATNHSNSAPSSP